MAYHLRIHPQVVYMQFRYKLSKNGDWFYAAIDKEGNCHRSDVDGKITVNRKNETPSRFVNSRHSRNYSIKQFIFVDDKSLVELESLGEMIHSFI